MTRGLGPTPADDIGADLETVWDRLASHASAAPAADPELTARVQGALMAEFDRTPRPVARRPRFGVPPLFRTSSLRSLLAAAALVALLGASVALAGAGVARLNQVPVDQPTPVVEEPSDDDLPDVPGPIVQPPARPGPDGIEDPDEDDDDADEDADDDEDAQDGAETDEPGHEDRPESDEPEDEPSDEPSDSPDDSSDDEPSDELEADEPD